MVFGHKPFEKGELILGTWLAVLVVIGSLTGIYSEFRWRKLFASAIENAKKKSLEIQRLRGITWKHEDTIIDHKEQIADLEDTIEVLRGEREKQATRILSLEDSLTKATSSYATLRMEYDQLHAADKLLKQDLDMTIGELNTMTLHRDRLLEAIKPRDEKIDKLVSRTNELNAQIDGLKYKFETRGGQVPDLNAAWHMKEKPVNVKQEYLLDDTPLDDSDSSVIDSQPYGE